VPEAKDVPDDRCGSNRRWCTVVEDYTSWVFNPRKVNPAPTTWADLTGDRLRQRVVYARPDQTAEGLATIVQLTRTMGRDAAFAYLRQLEPAVAAHYINTDTMSRVVSLGSTGDVANGHLAEDLNDVDQYGSLSIWYPTVPGSPKTTVAIPYG